MKRITRLIHGGSGRGERVWLNQFGGWTKDEGQAFVFDDAEASKRVKRLSHATLDDPPVPKQPEENSDV